MAAGPSTGSGRTILAEQQCQLKCPALVEKLGNISNRIESFENSEIISLRTELVEKSEIVSALPELVENSEIISVRPELVEGSWQKESKS